MPVDPRGLLEHREEYLRSVRKRCRPNNGSSIHDTSAGTSGAAADDSSSSIESRVAGQVVDAVLECYQRVQTLERMLNRRGKEAAVAAAAAAGTSRRGTSNSSIQAVKTTNSTTNSTATTSTTTNSTTTTRSIASIQQDLALAKTSHRSALWKLPNWVDPNFTSILLRHLVAQKRAENDPRLLLDNALSTPLVATSSSAGTEQCHQKKKNAFRLVVEDPAFCAGIYDTVKKYYQPPPRGAGGGGSRLPKQEECRECCVVTSLGANLLRRVADILAESLARVFTNNNNNTTIPRWEVPAILEHDWEEEKWNDCFGLSSSSSTTSTASSSSSLLFHTGGEQDNTSRRAVPSAFTVLFNETKSVFTDRELPYAFLLDCSDNNTITSSNHNNIQRDAEKTKSASSWTKRLATRNHLELVVVTGPSHGRDTQPCCQRLIVTLHDTLLSLLCGDDDDDDEMTKGIHLTIRPVCPDQLRPFESSAVQFLASSTLPCGNNGGDDGVVLATLYNYRDYCTGRRLVRHHHGTNTTTKECLHVVRVVMQVPEILHWLLHVNAAATTTTAVVPDNDVDDAMTTAAIHLPPRLFGPAYHRIPYIRRIERGKGGKRVVRDNVPMAPVVTTRSDHVSRATTTTTTTTTSSAERLSTGHRDDGLCAMIEAEAKALSYSFLPLYTKK
jgi:hypothetical protein